MPIKVLVADDSPTIRRRAAATLAEAGYEASCVEDGAAAWAQLEAGPFDLVLCDILMPQLDGYELCRRVKAEPRLANVPVLLLRGTFEPWDEQRAMDVGADGYVTKPFEPEALLSTLREVLPAEGGAPAAAPPVEVEAGAADEASPFGDEPSAPAPSSPFEEPAPLEVEPPPPVAPAAAVASVEADPFGDEPFGALEEAPVAPSAPPARATASAPPAPVVVAAPPAVKTAAVVAASAPADLDEAAVEKLVERVLQRMSSEQVERIVWEVVPDVAEALIRKRILEIEAKISGG